MNLEVIIAVVLGSAAIIEDLRKRMIPNWIPVAALAGGVACQVIEKGWIGIGAALLGAAAGFGIFLIFYLLGGMGGGDVKLMAGFGALLGVHRLLAAALWIAILGGLMAAIILAVDWIRSKRAASPAAASTPKTIPYAPAIVIGVWVVLIGKV